MKDASKMEKKKKGKKEKKEKNIEKGVERVDWN